MIEVSLLDYIVATFGVILTLSLLSCLCCICMKISDLRLRSYILEMANKKGIEVDLDKLESKYALQPSHSNDNCTIIIPEVAVVL